MKEGDEVEIPILKTPIITWRYYRRKVQELTVWSVSLPLSRLGKEQPEEVDAQSCWTV